MSNGLDPDQNRRSVGPDLDSNCLSRVTADVKSHGYSRERVKCKIAVTYKDDNPWITRSKDK